MRSWVQSLVIKEEQKLLVSSGPLYFTLLIVCLCVCLQAHVHICMHACGGHRLTLGAFLNYSPLYFSRQGLSLELTHRFARIGWSVTYGEVSV